MKFQRQIRFFMKWWLIPIIGILLYSHSLGNQFVIDDASQIKFNKSVHSLNIPSLFLGSTFADDNGPVGIYYKPVMTSFYAIIYSLFGYNPIPFHLVQITLHILNALLVFLLFKKFLSVKLSLLLSLIFLVHPINTQAVVYISSLQDPLFFSFGMIGLLAVTKNELDLKDYLIFSGAMFLSVLSKETGILFLLVSPLLSSRRMYILSVFIGAAYFLIHHLAVGITIQAQNSFPIMGASLLERLITMPKIAYYYLKTFFYPAVLPGDQMWVIRNLDWSNFLLPVIADSAFLAIVLLFFVYLLKSKSSYLKQFTFFFLWFAFGLGLHLQLIPLDGTVADRWFYFPIVGLLGMLGILVKSLKLHKLFMIIALALIILLSVRTFIRTLDWKDGLTLSLHDYQFNHDNYALENNLGYELIQAGRYDDALPHIQKSIELAPWSGQNWDNLGIIYRHIGYVKQDPEYIKMAIDSFIKAANSDPSYIPAEDLAETLTNFRSPERAIKFLNSYSEVVPLSGPMWYWMAVAKYNSGDQSGALEAAKQAVLKIPDHEAVNYLYHALLNNQTIELSKPVY